MTWHSHRSLSLRGLLSLVLLHWLGCFQEVSASYVVTVKPDSEECVFLFIPKEQRADISGSFECIDDDVGSKEMSVSLSNAETGEVLYDAPSGARGGHFSVMDSKSYSNKVYAFCIGNHVDDEETDGSFDVGFSIRVTYPSRALPEGEIGPDTKKASELVTKATSVQQAWNNMLDHYEFVRNREALHQEMNDSILSRLSWWTYIEALLVVGMATGQVLYWKRFFETRRYL